MKKSLLFVGGAILASVLMSGCITRNTSQGAYAPEVTVEKKYEAVIEKKAAAASGEAIKIDL